MNKKNNKKNNKNFHTLNINNKLISLKIKNLILGYIIKKGKKKKAIGLLNKSLNVIFNHYCFNPLQLLKVVIYQHFSMIRKKNILSKKSNKIIRKIYYKIPFEIRLKKAVQSIMTSKKINKKKYIFFIYLVQLLILQLPNKNKKIDIRKKSKKFKKLIIFRLFRLMNLKYKKIKKKNYNIKKRRIINKRINRIKNPKSKKNKQYI